MLQAKHFATTPPRSYYHSKIQKRSHSKRYNHISCQETVMNIVRSVGGESSTPVDLPPVSAIPTQSYIIMTEQIKLR
jgi:hypothetical protein